MNKDNLIVWIGMYLEKHEFIQASLIQNQILYSTDKKTLIPVEEITDVLDFLVFAGFLEVYSGSKDTPCIYIRFLPPMIKKKLHQ